MKRSHLVREVVETLVLTLLIFVVIHFVVQSYHIDGTSMQPTLNSSEYVVVNKTAYMFQQPGRGDVIVFHYPLQPSQDYIKRVIGLPGDHIKTDLTHVWVNGQLLNEKYISAPANQGTQQWTVPKNDYFVMGDNRPVSDDSRIWGFVPQSYIIGKAVLVYWPVPDWQVLNTFPATYAAVKPVP